MRRLTLGVLLALVLPAAPVVADAGTPDAGPPVVERKAVPRLKVTKRVTGLSNPWDVKSLGDGRLLITERDTARLFVVG